MSGREEVEQLQDVLMRWFPRADHPYNANYGFSVALEFIKKIDQIAIADF